MKENRKIMLKPCITVLCLILVCMSMFTMTFAGEEISDETGRVQKILEGMDLEEKISQMIIPAIRTWNEENVTDLSVVPELAEALRKHQYGGIILYGSNVTGTEQVTRLVSDLQANNAAIENVSSHIPYFMPVDQEGGIVTRIVSGTRMTGNMAIGATGVNASENARITGMVIGEELAAAGFNVNFAPDIDVNNNAANPVIGTRAFSDDARIVSELGAAYGHGLMENNIIPTYKHYPGHGDTGTDSHIGTASIDKSYDEIKATELVPFEYVISDGADMIMTAHITYPQIDDEVIFGDGETKGYYPATMSEKMITQILREEMGFDGVVVTDALEMNAIATAGLVPGEENSAEYRINIAEKVINAGVDILLLPLDMINEEAVKFYDDYIEGLQTKVAQGIIPESKIDAAVLRILELKEKYGILDADVSGANIEEAVAKALDVIGSDEHHRTEMEIARQAITMLKNDGALPVDSAGRKIVIAARQAAESMTIAYAISQMQEQNVIDPQAQIINLVSGLTTGNSESQTRITIDYYYDPSGEETKLHYTDELKAAVSEADTVICLSKTFNLDAMAETSEQYLGISGIIKDTHAAGGKSVLLCNNLPYDASRYQDADAILIAFMGSGLDMDPTARADGSANMQAYNANVVAALHMIFGEGSPTGTLPVNIPVIAVNEDGSLSYTDEILYERGTGLSW